MEKYEEVVKMLEKADREYNKKLFMRLVKIYGIENAKEVYDKMRREGEEEINYLIEMTNANGRSI